MPEPNKLIIATCMESVFQNIPEENDAFQVSLFICQSNIGFYVFLKKKRFSVHLRDCKAVKKSSVYQILTLSHSK